MVFWLILAILFILFLVLFPGWPYNRTWGYGPSLCCAGLLLALYVIWAIGALPGWGAHRGWRSW